MNKKKIVAIGGGENGRIKSDGTKKPYETAPMDKEIIKLTGKENPNFLFIAHSQLPEFEVGYFDTMRNIYEKLYNCPCKILLSSDLYNKEKIKELVDWADIIYEGGGNTKRLIELWNKTGFDKILNEAWNLGKVLCGVSAGANCWFNACSSDALRIELNDETAPLIEVKCLNLVNAFFTPHCDENNRLEETKKFLLENNLIGISLSNCAAIEIIDDMYRIITGDVLYNAINPYGIKSYWKDGEYIQEDIEISNEFKSLNELLNKG